jgi:hypothetical protein
LFVDHDTIARSGRLADVQPTRRQVLLAGATLTVASAAACTTKKRPEPAGPDPDERLRAEAVAREQALVEAYLAALKEHPGLTHSLGPVLGDHAAHLAALGGTPPSADATPDASPTPGRVTPAGRTTQQEQLRQLLAQERHAAAAHAKAAEVAEADVECARTLAPLLASLAASEASHAVVLT